MLNEPDRYEIYTDGSARKNGDECGWAYVIYKNGNLIGTEYENGIQNSTNNRMEITALLRALQWTVENTYHCDTVTIYSDSAYVVNMFNDWVRRMASRSWKKADGCTPENLDLLKEMVYYAEIGFPNFTIGKIPGHSEIEGNEIADALCTGNNRKLRKYIPVHSRLRRKERVPRVPFCF